MRMPRKAESSGQEKTNKKKMDLLRQAAPHMTFSTAWQPSAPLCSALNLPGEPGPDAAPGGAGSFVYGCRLVWAQSQSSVAV